MVNWRPCPQVLCYSINTEFSGDINLRIPCADHFAHMLRDFLKSERASLCYTMPYGTIPHHTIPESCSRPK